MEGENDGENNIGADNFEIDKNIAMSAAGLRMTRETHRGSVDNY